MTGKEKCQILRAVRNDVAVKNGLEPFEDTCAHTGDCPGTCPKCEWEVRELEKALDARKSLSKRVAVAGVSIGLCATLAGCSVTDMISTAMDCASFIAKRDHGKEETLAGDVPTEIIETLEGEVPFEEIEN